MQISLRSRNNHRTEDTSDNNVGGSKRLRARKSSNGRTRRRGWREREDEWCTGRGSLLTLEPKTAAGVAWSLILMSVSANYREIRE